MDLHDLVRQFADGAHAFREIVARMCRLAENLQLHEHAALAAGRHIAARPARFGIIDGARRAALALDDGPRGRRRDLLVGGDQYPDRTWRTAKPLERGSNEDVHDQTCLHVGNARAVGPVALDRERTARHLALREHRVAVPHQQDRLFVTAGLGDKGMDRIAEHVMRLPPRRYAVVGEVPLETRAYRIDAGLVVRT